jgi:hypothetical protein
MTVQVRLTLEQLLEAIFTLPQEERAIIRRSLDAELRPEDIQRRFEESLHEIWAANAHFNEEEVAADVDLAIREVREAHRAARGS